MNILRPSSSIPGYITSRSVCTHTPNGKHKTPAIAARPAIVPGKKVTKWLSGVEQISKSGTYEYIQ